MVIFPFYLMNSTRDIILDLQDSFQKVTTMLLVLSALLSLTRLDFPEMAAAELSVRNDCPFSLTATHRVIQ